MYISHSNADAERVFSVLFPGPEPLKERVATLLISPSRGSCSSQQVQTDPFEWFSAGWTAAVLYLQQCSVNINT